MATIKMYIILGKLECFFTYCDAKEVNKLKNGKMFIIRKTLAALTNNCKRGWRYDEGNCFFNTKGSLSVVLSVNFFSVLLFILGWKKTVNFVFSIDKSFPYVVVIAPILFFVLLSLIYSKKQVIAVQTTKKQERKALLAVILYSLLSIALLLLASIKR